MLHIDVMEASANKEKLRDFFNSLDERQRELYFLDVVNIDPVTKSFSKKLSDLVLKMDLVHELMRYFKLVVNEEEQHLEFHYFRESGAYGIITINDEETLAHAKLPWLRKLHKIVMGLI